MYAVQTCSGSFKERKDGKSYSSLMREASPTRAIDCKVADCGYDEVVCAVLTGMGADGTAGILNLMRKKRVTVLAQNEETCVVYGCQGVLSLQGLPEGRCLWNKLHRKSQKTWG